MQPDPVRVLAVEDNRADFRLLMEYLREGTNFQVVHALTLKHALGLLSADRFAVVLLDLNLPDSTRFEGLERILACPHTPPVIVLTEIADEDTGLQALSRNAQDYLVKGRIDSNILVRSIRYAIARHKAEEAVRQLNAQLEQRVAEQTAEIRAANEMLEQRVADRTAELLVANENLRSLMEEASDGILMTDERGNIVAANTRLCEILGRDKNELLALTLQDLMPGEDSSLVSLLRAEKTTMPPEVLEHRLSRKDGAIIYVQTSMKKLSNGCLQSIVRDVTKQKERELRFMHVVQEEVLEKLFLKLRAFKHGQSGAMNLNRLALFADNFAAISRSLTAGPPEEGRDLLDRFTIAVEEFSTNVAPELEHIASLMTVVEANPALSTETLNIRSTADTLLTAIERLKERIYHIMSLTKGNRAALFAQAYPTVQEDILSTISKIRYALKDVSAFIETNFTSVVSDIVRATVQKFEAETWNSLFRFDDGTPGSKAIANASELASMLSILIENSLEAFGKSAKSRRQVAMRTEASGNAIRIVVEDNGPGVPDDMRDHLFERGVSGKGEGRGFGLSYAKKCISKYGGRIYHDPSPGTGARFVIEIPKA